ncbi:hypothetical protein [Massilia glaciei]|uniref:Uncharacterized protein n=1 Tax=Massilia glaciei TaxID=1524097 RepID=A0A2U2I7F0_9BURK|nr:hypothetical protein [Massilia glaciei]PWF55673.1 hypothetical protein C7C56_000730 [Massilia glaciei]
MQKLTSELNRLYLAAGTLSAEVLAQRMQGQASPAISLTTDDGLTRAMVIAFDKIDEGEGEQHWERLCTVANRLQTELGFPAPAVSISGANGYCLWLSLKTPAPATLVQQFVELVRKTYAPEMALHADATNTPVELPPCLNQRSGKWAAFINPGLGASFAEESGLEMAPPLAGQSALLLGLESISDAQFKQAFETLQQSQGAAPMVIAQPKPGALAPDGLLLRDATLEDIVSFLHSKNIEPTFRHLIPKP